MRPLFNVRTDHCLRFSSTPFSASCATKAVEQEDVVSIPVEPYVPTWKCIDCTPEEQFVL